MSTADAEYVVMADGVKEALHVRGMLFFSVPSLELTSTVVTNWSIFFEDNKREPLTWRKTR